MDQKGSVNTCFLISFLAENLELQFFMLWGAVFQIFAASFMKVVDVSLVSLGIDRVMIEEDLVHLSPGAGSGCKRLLLKVVQAVSE